jgi:hypothetical protein
MSNKPRLSHSGSRFTLWAAAAAATAFLMLSPADGFAQSRIGIAAQVKNQVDATLSGQTRTLGLGNNVFAGERIRTGQASNAQLTFLDQTNLTIGSQSDVVLDRFVFDPNRGVGNVALSATQGALRFISGAQNPNSYRINTPAATITVRGTLAYWIGYGNVNVVGNGHGLVSAILNPTGQVINIPQGYALVVLLPVDPTNPNFRLVKWDFGLLGVDQLAQLLPQFENLPDSLNDLMDQHDAANAPPCLSQDGPDCYVPD